MAAGDINSRTVDHGSALRVVHGTLTADQTGRQFQIADTNTYILGAHIFDQDDAIPTLLVLNSSDGTEGTAIGSLYIRSSVENTIRYMAWIK